jgi:hypothetical protein
MSFFPHGSQAAASVNNDDGEYEAISANLTDHLSVSPDVPSVLVRNLSKVLSVST